MAKKAKPSKRDHFISQFYLAGFTSDGTQDGEIYCFDLHKRTYRLAKTRTIAFENHFNDIDSTNEPVDGLESRLSALEGQISPAFVELRTSKTLPNGTDLGKILNFMALVIVRNPAVRQAIDDARTVAHFAYLEGQLKSKASWEKLKGRMQASGITSFDNLSYEDAKQKLLPRTIRIQGDPMSFHQVEFEKASEILPLLAMRSWEVVIASSPNSFITSDRPASMVWTGPCPPPSGADGLTSIHSAILFPVSSDVLLLGAFPEDEYKSDPALRYPPSINNLVMTRANRFVYSSKSSFLALSWKQTVYSSDECFSKSAPSNPSKG